MHAPDEAAEIEARLDRYELGNAHATHELLNTPHTHLTRLNLLNIYLTPSYVLTQSKDARRWACATDASGPRTANVAASRARSASSGAKRMARMASGILLPPNLA